MKKIFIALLLLLAQSSTPAFARLDSSQGRSAIASSGKWAVVATAQGQPTTNAPYTLSWSVTSGVAYNFFVFRNSGTLAISSFVADITQVQSGGSGRPNDTVFELCSGGIWNSTSNTCSGVTTLMGRASNLALQFNNMNLSPGAELSMRASTATNVKNSYTTTLSVIINRSQVRLGQIFNS